MVKDDHIISGTNRGLSPVGVSSILSILLRYVLILAPDDIIDTEQHVVSPLIPIIQAGVAAAEQTDIGRALKEGIDKFSEGIPVLMKALNELKGVHPFIGGELIP
jgi:hypothetical protein